MSGNTLKVQSIPQDNIAWSDVTPSALDWQFRINVVKGVEMLWRKNIHPSFYGGHQILYIILDSRLAREWLKIAGYDTFALNMLSKN